MPVPKSPFTGAIYLLLQKMSADGVKWSPRIQQRADEFMSSPSTEGAVEILTLIKEEFNIPREQFEKAMISCIVRDGKGPLAVVLRQNPDALSEVSGAIAALITGYPTE